MGTLPQWSEVPRFHAGFWTDAPLVDREKVVQERDGFAGGRRKLRCQDHLVNSGQINNDVVPSTPVKYRENNSGIVQARRSNCDHLRGIAEVNPEVSPPTPRKHMDNNSGIVRARQANMDHLAGAASVNHEVVPATPIKQIFMHNDTLEARRCHLVGMAGINLDLVPEETGKQFHVNEVCHLLGGGAQVNPDAVPGTPRRRWQHPASHLICGGCVIVETSPPGRNGLRDWWGQEARTSGSSCSTPQRVRKGRDVDSNTSGTYAAAAWPTMQTAFASRGPPGHTAPRMSARGRSSNAASVGSTALDRHIVDSSTCSPRLHRLAGDTDTTTAGRISNVNDASRGSGMATTIQDFLVHHGSELTQKADSVHLTYHK
jgi:hypothetical protein